MGKVSGLASSRKRHRKAPPAKVAPEKDEELVADDDDPWPSLEEMYVMLIDRVVEQVMIRTVDFGKRFLTNPHTVSEQTPRWSDNKPRQVCFQPAENNPPVV